MLINSVYAKEKEVAVVGFCLKQHNQGVIPSSVWRSSLEDLDYVQVVKNDLALMPLKVVVNSDPFKSENKQTSYLKETLNREGVEDVSISSQFDVVQGLSVLQLLERDDLLIKDAFTDLPRMLADLKRSGNSQSAATLAFLQGIIFADNLVRKPKGIGFGMRLGGNYRTWAAYF